MKITIITGPFNSIPPNTIGAVERLWYNIACVLIKKGHNVFFVSKRYDQADKNGINTDGIYIDYIKGFKSKRYIIQTIYYDFFYSIRALWKMKKCDILVMNTFWTPILCILFRYKYKVSVYNVARIPKGQFKFYKNVDRLSCVSIIVGDILVKQTPSAKKQIKIINNPINTDVFYSAHNNRNDNLIKLIYTGRIHPEKGLDILVKSFCKLKDEYTNLQLSIVGARDIARGGGGQKYVDYLISLAGNYNINFIEPIYIPEQLRDEILSHDIFCYPSIAEKGETFGVAPLEAMATGVPTILSDLECFRDFAKNGENALIFNHRMPHPEIELYNSIRKLVNDKNLREKIALNGAKTAKRFSTEKIAEEYIQDFKSLLENSVKK